MLSWLTELNLRRMQVLTSLLYSFQGCDISKAMDLAKRSFTTSVYLEYALFNLLCLGVMFIRTESAVAQKRVMGL